MNRNKFTNDLRAAFVSWQNINRINDMLVERRPDLNARVREYAALDGVWESYVGESSMREALECANDDFMAVLSSSSSNKVSRESASQLLDRWRTAAPSHGGSVVFEDNMMDQYEVEPEYNFMSSKPASHHYDMLMEGRGRYGGDESSGGDAWFMKAAEMARSGRPAGQSYYRARRVEQIYDTVGSYEERARGRDSARTGARHSAIVGAATARLCSRTNEN